MTEVWFQLDQDAGARDDDGEWAPAQGVAYRSAGRAAALLAREAEEAEERAAALENGEERARGSGETEWLVPPAVGAKWFVSPSERASLEVEREATELAEQHTLRLQEERRRWQQQNLRWAWRSTSTPAQHQCPRQQVRERLQQLELHRWQSYREQRAQPAWQQTNAAKHNIIDAAAAVRGAPSGRYQASVLGHATAVSATTANSGHGGCAQQQHYAFTATRASSSSSSSARPQPQFLLKRPSWC